MRLRAHRLAAFLVAVGIAATATAVSTSAGEGATARTVAQVEAADVQNQRCFGAASRDPERPCHNRALRYVVTPTPEEASQQMHYPCTPLERQQELYACAFGAPEREAVKTIALIGDSHAGHWRAALDQAAIERGWYGISLTQTGCPMTTRVPILKGELRENCQRWNQQLIPWLERNPDVSEIYVSQHGGKVAPEPGEQQDEAQINGFIEAFEQLPPTVKRVVVIRGSAWGGAKARRCIEKAIVERRRADKRCALPRERSLKRDTQAEAARQMKSPLVKLVNLTPFFCDSDECFPVIGGALVHKDGGHMTQLFSRTLGPYLGRALDRLPPVGS